MVEACFFGFAKKNSLRIGRKLADWQRGWGRQAAFTLSGLRAGAGGAEARGALSTISGRSRRSRLLSEWIHLAK